MKKRIYNGILKSTLIFSLLFGIFFVEFPFGDNEIILLNKGNYFKVIYGKSKLNELRELNKNLINKILKENKTKEQINYDYVKYQSLSFKNSFKDQKKNNIIFSSGGFVTNIWSFKKQPNQKYLTLFNRGAVGISYIQLTLYVTFITINIFLLLRIKIEFNKSKIDWRQ